MSAIPRTDHWVEFFETYRKLPALWRVKDEQYKNKRMRNAGYETLLACYQKIDPTANVDTMRSKINGIRTCYRREQRKVEQSELLATKAIDIYIPHLWYFSNLSFLRSGDGSSLHAPAVADNSNSCSDEQVFEEEKSNNTDMKDNSDNWSATETKLFETIPPSPHESPLHQTCLEQQQEQQLPPEEQSQPTTPFQAQLMPNLNHSARDEADIYAEGWATSYRKLDEMNRLLAKKAIEEILVLGQLNKLEFNSVRMPN